MKMFTFRLSTNGLLSDEAEDLNEDGELDEADYELFADLL